MIFLNIFFKMLICQRKYVVLGVRMIHSIWLIMIWSGGKLITKDTLLFEFLILESFPAGLSWITILRKC